MSIRAWIEAWAWPRKWRELEKVVTDTGIITRFLAAYVRDEQAKAQRDMGVITTVADRLETLSWQLAVALEAVHAVQEGRRPNAVGRAPWVR